MDRPEESRLPQKVFTVFGDGNNQGSARTETPEQALFEVLSEFGRVVAIDDEYIIDTRVNPGISEYDVYEGAHNNEPEDIEPMRYDVTLVFGDDHSDAIEKAADELRQRLFGEQAS